ncbi:hypothetical protein BGZ50_000330, partial [Haplosporangium sp. Z 11]
MGSLRRRASNWSRCSKNQSRKGHLRYWSSNEYTDDTFSRSIAGHDARRFASKLLAEKLDRAHPDNRALTFEK